MADTERDRVARGTTKKKPNHTQTQGYETLNVSEHIVNVADNITLKSSLQSDMGSLLTRKDERTTIYDSNTTAKSKDEHPAIYSSIAAKPKDEHTVSYSSTATAKPKDEGTSSYNITAAAKSKDEHTVIHISTTAAKSKNDHTAIYSGTAAAKSKDEHTVIDNGTAAAKQKDERTIIHNSTAAPKSKDERTVIYSSTVEAKSSNGDHSGAVNGDGNGTIRLDQSEEVERVIKEQKTHHLFCPNCNKCITDTVILRKRSGETVEDNEIRCFSCFSILLPTIRWKPSVRDPSQLPTSTTPPTSISSAPHSTAIPIPSATDGGDTDQIDIMKSIVYGGLLEAIASLSVVTSAAGADAKTLNIVALGAANMFGGLFVLAHNLRVLKQETNEERYEEVLGRQGHFTLHSVIAVMSYLVFGLLPPLIYGFTFRKSDNRDYKLIAVAMASLVCIILLALAKSYIRKPPKDYMKTLVYYLGLWITACGVSYLSGDLFDLLLQKLGWFESSGSIAMPFPVGEFRAVN